MLYYPVFTITLIRPATFTPQYRSRPSLLINGVLRMVTHVNWTPTQLNNYKNKRFLNIFSSN